MCLLAELMGTALKTCQGLTDQLRPRLDQSSPIKNRQVFYLASLKNLHLHE